MPLSEAFKQNTAQYTVVRILTVDPPNRTVQGTLRDGGKVTIGVFDTASAFRWPKVDEAWMIRRNGVTWELVNRLRSVYEQSLETLQPGELSLDADRIVDAQGRRILVAGDIADDPTSMHWRGDWSAIVTYEPNDVVYDSGSPWLALDTNTNSEPSDINVHWRQLASPPAPSLSKVVFPLGTITANTPIPLNHYLGTLDVVVSVYSVSTGETVITDTTYLNADTVQVTFGSSFPSGSYRVVIIG